jgi:hypothetical protein
MTFTLKTMESKESKELIKKLSEMDKNSDVVICGMVHDYINHETKFAVKHKKK